ncbi:hypothetical protein BEWA_046300 [Theileria equi strain WA]|uniref:Uncharacterized protein n=1 Tax=Theileria equi strain WA TaxID=1537102 RepID=L1L9J3_THEEQ|nr:hypothetical protein BEWA_046300 [Theileria equi strain WA]EKX72166.1 hypothetical protein BEWA_046300 [Theileria equi strain WA]|eukprot:XP_004831618.1 hypothetical protein BEWA_046300 [Theileria equi strain WA]
MPWLSARPRSAPVSCRMSREGATSSPVKRGFACPFRSGRSTRKRAKVSPLGTFGVELILEIFPLTGCSKSISNLPRSPSKRLSGSPPNKRGLSKKCTVLQRQSWNPFIQTMASSPPALPIIRTRPRPLVTSITHRGFKMKSISIAMSYSPEVSRPKPIAYSKTAGHFYSPNNKLYANSQSICHPDGSILCSFGIS